MLQYIIYCKVVCIEDCIGPHPTEGGPSAPTDPSHPSTNLYYLSHILLRVIWYNINVIYIKYIIIGPYSLNG